MPDFPDGFPEAFEKTLRDAGATEQEINVYRIAKNGILNREAFLSTYEEEKGLSVTPKRNKSDISYYSTSCSLSLEKMEKLLKIFMQRPPKPIILKGITSPKCGLSQITIRRKPDSKDPDHVDWWLYKDVNPCDFFEEVADE